MKEKLKTEDHWALQDAKKMKIKGTGTDNKSTSVERLQLMKMDIWNKIN